MAVIKNNLRVLIAKWEVENNQKLSLEKLSAFTGIGANTLGRYTRGTAKRVDLSVCAKLLVWFHSQGYFYTMADLFELRTEEEPKHDEA